VKKANIEKAVVKHEKVETNFNTLKNELVYNVAVGKSGDNNLLSFQAQEDYYEPSERRGRGSNRGGPRPARGGAAPTQKRSKGQQ